MIENENKKLINSFKNGLVPDRHLDFLLTGRQAEIEELQRCFDQTQNDIGTIKFITGPYGSGKTFLLDYSKNIALDLGFVVAKIEVDSNFKFYNLEQLYYHVMHNLFVHNSALSKTTFENIFDLWIRKLKSNNYKHHASKEIQYVISEIGKYNQSFARAFLSYIKGRINGNKELTSAIVSWITGEGSIPYQLKEQVQIKGRINQSNSIDFLKAFTKLITLLGYQGMIIMVDEMDVIMNERSDIRQKCYYNLRHLIDLTIGGQIPNTCFMFSGSHDLFYSDKGIKSYEALRQRLGTSIDMNHSIMLDIKQPVMHLKRLPFDVFYELGEKLTYIYKKVHPLDLQISIESLKNWVFLTYKEQGKSYGEITIREFITKYIEIMDIIHQNPKHHIFNSELSAVITHDQIIYKASQLKKG
ncbi:hypothetical protein EZV73_20140 [Acidaminobacter sp. JC074]|uniref:BREX system ATP-binding domain-containing protein n=1 Tax=Acidaminobacter sp. JC074 TaxID=2530199 RepID=UPI001F11313E|nr:BREX system ATP-binding domain-containing protein [Acidaminobacter sp. JC074]MCH4889901.1 hypothetical protein [Acidaminobacter sp. JC074]